MRERLSRALNKTGSAVPMQTDRRATMWHNPAAEALGTRSPIWLVASLTLALTASLVLVALSPHPALALTNGVALNTAFPRIAMWWPNGSAPLSDVSRLDYVVPYEWQPMQPNTSRLATLRSLNPSQVVFADASTCELNYRQPDSAGNPSGSASYDTERLGAIPTSWILTQVGTTLSAPISTVTKPTQSITVADGTKFRAGNLVIIGDEKCQVVSVSGSTLSVRRGWAGSAAVNHASGTRIAAAVSAWPYSVKVDLTDECPAGRATGEIATPGTGTERARDWMVRRTASHYRAAGFDGVAIDLGIGYMSWFKGTNNYQFLSIASRANPAVEVDYTAYDAKWSAALNAFQTALRANVGPDAIILVNEATPAFAALNGARIEGFPEKTTTTSKWHSKIIGPNKTYFPSYLEWCASARQPNFTTLQTYGTSVTDYQLMRFGLTSALLGNGLYAFKVGGTNSVLYYDEFDNAGAGRGYLGAPLGAPVLAGGPDVYRRDFEGGVALVNATDVAVTVNLGATFRKIKGTQAPSVNDGSLVTAVTIPAKDGLVLLRPGPVGTFTVAGGATQTDSPEVLCASDVRGANEMRIDPGTGTFGDWSPYLASTPVQLEGSYGPKTVRAEYRNAAGTTQLTAYVEFVAPAWLATSIAGIPDGWVNEDVAFHLTATEPDPSLGVSTFYGLNGPALLAYSAPVTVTAEGKTVVSYFSVDAFGNAEATETATVAIDKTPPSISLDATATYAGSATVAALADDELSGLGRVEMNLDGGDWFTSTQLSTHVVGTHTVIARAFDAAGNERDARATFSVLASPRRTHRHHRR
jgi:hypothetical protein